MTFKTLWLNVPAISLASRRRFIQEYGGLSPNKEPARDEILEILIFDWLLRSFKCGDQAAFEIVNQVRPSIGTHAEEMLDEEEHGIGVASAFTLTIADGQYVGCPYREKFYDVIAGRDTALKTPAETYLTCDVNALWHRFQTKNAATEELACQANRR